jgi:hypothetical protein
MLKSVDSLSLGPICDRQFYLALRYFPRRFTAIHERLITLLSAAYLRSTRILNARFPRRVIQPVPDYVSIGLLAHLTIPVVQRALGSQLRATITAALNKLSAYQSYYNLVASDSVASDSIVSVASDSVASDSVASDSIVSVASDSIVSVASDSVASNNVRTFDYQPVCSLLANKCVNIVSHNVRTFDYQSVCSLLANKCVSDIILLPDG